MKIKIEIEIDTIEDRQELDDIILFIKTQLHDPVTPANKKQTSPTSTGHKRWKENTTRA